MKRLLTLMLAVLLLLAMLVPAMADGVGVRLPVTVRVSGKVPAQAEYVSIVLTAADATCPMPDGAQDGAYTMRMRAGSESSFPEIVYTAPGNYIYTIRQRRGNTAGCTYDASLYVVEVCIAPGDDGLYPVIVVQENEGTTKLGGVTFRNTYREVTPTPVPTSTPTPTPRVTVTPVPNVTVTPVPGVTVTPVPGVTVTPIPNVTATPVPGVTVTPIPGITATPVPDVTVTPIPNVTATPVPGVTVTPIPNVTATPVPGVTVTPIPGITATPVPGVTVTPIPNVTATPVPGVTVTPVPNVTVTPVPGVTVTPVPDVTVTPVPTKAPPAAELPPTGVEDYWMLYLGGAALLLLIAALMLRVLLRPEKDEAQDTAEDRGAQDE